MSLRVLLLGVLVAACHRESEVQGVYMAQGGSGVLFPCDEDKVRVVRDSALQVRYNVETRGNEPVFVRLRGIKGRSGSPKGGGQWWFLVREVIEVRPRVAGDCPGVAPKIGPLLPTS